MVGSEFSGGKPMQFVTMIEILSLETSFKPGEVTACVGGGTKGLTKAY